MTDIATPSGCYAFLDGTKFEDSGKISWTRNGADILGGNISPSSDSGLGSEGEEQSTLYENIQTINSDKTLSELSSTLTIDCDNEAREDKISEYSWQCEEYRNDSESQDLSLLLTTQNPARIDVKSLKKNKVSKSRFGDFCNRAGSEDELKGNSSMFCDKKLVAINHLYNINSSQTILSAKGTVRGIKNRVRAGIQTFAREKQLQHLHNEEYGQCVMYVTSLGIVRATKTRCSMVRKILRNLSVRVYERDVFMSRDHCMDLKERLGVQEFNLPQVFIHGHPLGDADMIEQLNETGELRQLLRPFQDPEEVSRTCSKCGGFGMYPCTVCEGSRRSYSNYHGTVMLRCTHCDKGGLMLCDACN